MFGPDQNLNLVIKSSYGPPFIYLPFLIFINMPFKVAEISITLVSIIGYLFAFYYLWKSYYKETTALFWLLLGVMSFSFPISYSLGMGNPIGIVTLGVYSLFVLKDNFWKRFLFVISSLLKIFPISVLSYFVFNKLNKKELFYSLMSLLTGLLLSIVLLPKNIWFEYLIWLNKINPINKEIINPSIYNQSYSSTVSRFLKITDLPPFYYHFFIFVLIAVVVYYIWLSKKRIKVEPLDASVFILSFSLLIHPYPWQYYFAVLLPYLVLKVASKNYIFLIPLILMSIDGNRFFWSGLLKYFFDSAQFFSTLILFFMILFSYLYKIKVRTYKL